VEACPAAMSWAKIAAQQCRGQALPFLAACFLCATLSAADAQTRTSAADPALTADLLGWASRLSGLPAASAAPRMQALSANDLMRRVCTERPEDCRTLVAVYDTDTKQVLYLDSLDLRDETDQSFIVHELVHYLQHQRDGDQLFAGCEKVMRAEAQAYLVQNKYLAQFKQWRRVGEMLRFTHCAHSEAEPEYQPDQPSVLTGRSVVGR
jgi:hypothetical protein